MLVGLSKHRRLKRKTPPQQQRGPRAHTTQSREQTLTHLQKQRSSKKFNGQTHAVFSTTASRGRNGCMESAWSAQEVLVRSTGPDHGEIIEPLQVELEKKVERCREVPHRSGFSGLASPPQDKGFSIVGFAPLQEFLIHVAGKVDHRSSHSELAKHNSIYTIFNDKHNDVYDQLPRREECKDHPIERADESRRRRSSSARSMAMLGQLLVLAVR